MKTLFVGITYATGSSYPYAVSVATVRAHLEYTDSVTYVDDVSLALSDLALDNDDCMIVVATDDTDGEWKPE